MSTSNSWDFSLTATQLIQVAFEDLGVVSPGVAPSTAQATMALTRLGLIAKQFQGNIDGAPGVKVHTRQRINLFLAKGQQQYSIGPASGDARSTTQYGRTTVATAYVSGTSLSVAAVTDTTTFPGTTVSMTSGDFIGVQLNDGTIGWTTLNGTPGSSPATLQAGLASAAASGNYVWWFTSRAQRFPLIESAVLRDENFKDTELGIYTQVQEYEVGVADKYADGTPTDILVEPLRIATRVTLSSQPTDVKKTIVLTVLYPAEDYDSGANDLAFPQEAFRFLGWELAFALCPSVGRWTKEMEQSRQEAKAMYLRLNPEMSVLYFQPNA